MLLIFLALNWIFAMVIMCGIFKYDFGEVTIGDFIFLSTTSLIPLSSVAALIFALFTITSRTGIFSKKLF